MVAGCQWFRFKTCPVSTLAVLLYTVVFVTVLVHDKTPDISKGLPAELGLDIDRAYQHDLHNITSHPHPYTTHENDRVHQFLLQRLQSIASTYGDHVHIVNDLTSNLSFTFPDSTLARYFEGTNILVKIDGSQSQSTPTPSSPSIGDGLLLSAHYDSVATSYGATDNGMAVISLLHLVEYFARPEHRPQRTLVFNFNNAEEHGLNGAQLYFEHPWSKLTSSFINLEGAGAGGRPLLFRSTGLGPVRAFASPDIRYPTANVLGADAFKQGVVRSRTDFQIYSQGIPGEHPGMEGVDVAFYKRRAVYHTPMDSIKGMGLEEGKKSLWVMMDTARAAAEALLNQDGLITKKHEGAVYFDILGERLVLFPRTYLLFVNVATLILGPITLVLCLAKLTLLSQTRARTTLTEGTNPIWAQLGKTLRSFSGWGRFWIAFLVTILAQISLVVGYIKLNPFVIHSYPNLVIITFLSLSYLSQVLPFSFFSPSPPTSASLASSPPSTSPLTTKLFAFLITTPPHSQPLTQKLTTILNLYFLTWIFLVFETFLVGKLGIGGFYWITVWNWAVWIGGVGLAFLEAWSVASVDNATTPSARRRKLGEVNVLGEPTTLNWGDAQEGRRYVRGVRYEPASTGGDGGGTEGELTETEPTEITPLISQHRRRSQGGGEYVVGIDGEDIRVSDGPVEEEEEEGGEGKGWMWVWMWMVQMGSLVVTPGLLEFQLLVVLVDSLGNTMVDGSTPVIVYGAVSLFSFLIVINITPFAHRLSRLLTLFVFLLFTTSLIHNYFLAFPFTQESPLKVFFFQRVELDLGLASLPTTTATTTKMGSVLKSETFLTSPPSYIHQILSHIPSTTRPESNVTCETDERVRVGLLTCRWNSGVGNWPWPGVFDLDEEGSKKVAETKMNVQERSGRSDWLTVSLVRNPSSSPTSITTTTITNDNLGTKNRRDLLHSATLTIKGTNTRLCRVQFDKLIRSFNVRGSENEKKRSISSLNPGSYNAGSGGGGDGSRSNLTLTLTLNSGGGVLSNGTSADDAWTVTDPQVKMETTKETKEKETVKDLYFFTRTWDRTFVVDVDWFSSNETDGEAQAQEEEEEKLKGTISCEWSEFGSGTAGSEIFRPQTQTDDDNGGGERRRRRERVSGQIPALEEVIKFLPTWALPIEWMPGLVEVGARFEI